MSVPDLRPSIREEQKALTRSRLLRAAEAVFAERGFHGASVDEIARNAGVTTGALYSNFAGKEDLFLALFEQTIDGDIRDYSELFHAGSDPEQQTRAGADRWMAILRERPAYFQLFIEIWAYVVRKPELRERFAQRFSAIRTALGRLVQESVARQGVILPDELSDRTGTVIGALANGLALEKLIAPEAVPDELFGDLLVSLLHATGGAGAR